MISPLAMEWRDTLFLHWPVDAAALRERIPRELEIDTYDGIAWVGIVAFRIARARLRVLPPVLGLPAFGEVNVRTYVNGPGKAGVWFFSLDAASAVAVALGRRFVHLPYLRANVDVTWNAQGATYRCERVDPRAAPARFGAQASFGGDVRLGSPGSLDRWLVDRFCFYTTDARGRVVRGDVAHPPWLLRNAEVRLECNSLLEAARIVPQTAEPLVHVSPGVSTLAWPIRKVPHS